MSNGGSEAVCISCSARRKYSDVMYLWRVADVQKPGRHTVWMVCPDCQQYPNEERCKACMKLWEKRGGEAFFQAMCLDCQKKERESIDSKKTSN